MAALMSQEAVRVGPQGLPGELAWPARAVGLVVFAHGSPRNRFVAAALQAAALRPGRVSALVLRGGRADLAGPLARVQAPTMLIVGGADGERLPINRAALHALHCEKRLQIVPGASHLFEEPGALDAVAHLAADWFIRHATERLQ